ncbi:MAG: uracil-DNA glycosylase [Clostridiales bacterium]|nr:uracil-DNA glycosylase [Clostridiales bacterium]
MQAFNAKMCRFFQTLWPAEEKPIVLGEGQSDHPPVMLIGEAPGEQESLQGRPFVGKAGKNLDGFLEVLSLNREDIYITNVVKIRPTKVSEKGRVSNRPPNREELALFTPYLMEEILLVQPQMIVTLGNVALRSLCGTKAVIGDMHGQKALVTVRHEKQEATFALFPLYHPASIIYNRALQEVYQADLQSLRALLYDPR